jgi:hypothetical protein
MESIEKDLNEVKNSVEFVHAEEQDLKKENEKAKWKFNKDWKNWNR